MLDDDNKIIMTSVKLTKKTHREAKLTANLMEITMSEVVELALKNYVEVKLKEYQKK